MPLRAWPVHTLLAGAAGRLKASTLNDTARYDARIAHDIVKTSALVPSDYLFLLDSSTRSLGRRGPRTRLTLDVLGRW